MRKIVFGLIVSVLAGLLVVSCGQQAGPLPEVLVVVSQSPASNASGVSPDETLSVTFKFPIEIENLSVGDFLASFGNDHAAGTPEISSAKLEWSSDHKTATISGITGWSGLPGSVGPATVDVVAAGGKIKDIFGNGLRAEHLLWNFDLAGIVASVSPESGATDVPVDTQIKVLFSNAMDASTINSSTFKLAGSSVPGTVSYDAATKTATFTPSQILQHNHTYIATLGAEIKDANGADLGKDGSWSFTTADIAGVLDPSYGTNGVAFYTNPGGDDFGYAVFSDAAGRTLVSASLWNGANMDLAVLRYDSNGNLDTSFGSGGVARYDSGGTDFGDGMAVDASGRILVSGYAWNGLNGDLAVVRFSTDGTLDTTFGAGGVARYDGGAAEDRGFGIAIDASGRILACGYSAAGATADLVAVRFSSSGVLDTGFGSGGAARYSAGFFDMGFGIAVNASNRILVSGYGSNGTDNDIIVLRYDSSGTLDSSFATGGVARYDGGNGEDQGYRITTEALGGIFVTGSVSNGATRDMAILKYDSGGNLDSSFGTGGVALYDAGGWDRGSGIIMDPRGRILVAGYSNNGSDNDMAVWRYNAGGSRDASFGANGVLLYDSGQGDDFGYGITFDPWGRVLAVGSAYSASDRDIASWWIK